MNEIYQVDFLMRIDYTNWRGERSVRRIIPNRIYFGSNEWHPNPGWILVAYDLEKNEEREFSMMNIHHFLDKEYRYK